MKNILLILPRWFAPAFVMLLIFAISSQPGDSLPDFLNWDYLVKKMGHVIGYGLLAWSYLHYLRYDRRYYWLAWLACLLYAATDEFHQSFISGRSSSIFDVLGFDNLGAALALWYHSRYQKRNASHLDQT